MNVDPLPPPLPPAAPPPPAPEPPPRSRGWFVAIAWVTLILFGLFVAGITLVAATIPQIKQSRENRR